MQERGPPRNDMRLLQTPGMLLMASGVFSQRSGLRARVKDMYDREVGGAHLNSSASSPQRCFALFIARSGINTLSPFLTLTQNM